MLEDLSAVRTRIAQIEDMFANLRGPSPVPTGGAVGGAVDAGAASFGAVLDQVQRQQQSASSAAASTAAGAGTSGFTQSSWARDLLQRLGAPVTQANVTALVAWERAEGGNWNNSAHYNPLNTTQAAPGSTTINSVGVRSYGDYETGMAATLQTLTNGHYQGILNALRAGASAEAVRQAVVTSPWGTSASAFRPELLAGAAAG